MRQMTRASSSSCRRIARLVDQQSSYILRSTRFTRQTYVQTRSPVLSRFLSTSCPRRFADTESLHKESLGPQTFYELFPQSLPAGPPPQGPFSVDEKQLRREFLQLQALAHPDRHPQEVKNRAEAASARINEAYKTLQNPLSRAQYLLSLQGVDVAEDETAKVEDPELLMEVLEMRENIEAAQDESELVPMKKTNDGRVEDSVQILDKAFRDDDMEKAKNEAIKLRYWINIRESLNAWEPGKPVVLIH